MELALELKPVSLIGFGDGAEAVAFAGVNPATGSPGIDGSLLSMPGIADIAIDRGARRATSHRFMNLISSVWERLMRAPRVRISLFSVWDEISAVISTACE
jgi:hypothetical protein